MGTGGATSLPKQTCGLASIKTALAGRRYRGRMYLPFPSVTMDTGDGVPTAGYQVNVVNAVTVMLSVNNITVGGRTANWNTVLVHKAGKTPIPASPTPITTFVIDGGWATQRKRGYFGRINESPI